MRIKQGPYTEQIDKLTYSKQRREQSWLKQKWQSKKKSVYSHIYAVNATVQQKVFPHCGEKGFAFSKRVQGFKLSEASLKALKRG